MSKSSEKSSKEQLQRRVGGFRGRPLASLSAFVNLEVGAKLGTVKARRDKSGLHSNSPEHSAAFDSGSPQNERIRRAYVVKECVAVLIESICRRQNRSQLRRQGRPCYEGNVSVLIDGSCYKPATVEAD